ncbi:uncharacterized protein LOC111043271 [Nilaparvata lugens]|uniref:uncharacterized protein LOC111043271 n=1 Tax=Nilaparvata lugens TaxID=108931 RepID=UPI00193CE9C6|nr:uncharacterized protein LOC111043271 [Nilaparvata lugens]XP_039283817.1 uncharacterized protein LOC111043271 [Nilaparvata lugens]XP_039283818.1 uncharacterized protein LOC111043271 [Nilaparvata lugens]XP_039283819.1 uncharacterized protein LOC111043271 [Nilaparvata lugens]
MAIVVSAKSKVITALLLTGLGTALTMLIGGMSGWFETDNGKMPCDPNLQPPSLNGAPTSQGCHHDADAASQLGPSDVAPRQRHHKQVHHRHVSHNHHNRHKNNKREHSNLEASTTLYLKQEMHPK